MRKARHDNSLLKGAAAVIAVTLALYGLVLYRWFAKPSAAPDAPAAAAAASTPSDSQLQGARAAFREGYLDATAWIRLSEALTAAGRPIDGFYVLQGAREFFGAEAFSKAHAILVLKIEPVETEDKSPLALARQQAAKDVMSAIPQYAQLAHAGPHGYTGQRAVDELARLASAREDAAGAEASRMAKEALEELQKAHPEEPYILGRLAMALWARGDQEVVRALALEAERRKPGSASSELVAGFLALQDKDADAALRHFTAVWEKNPDDEYGARQAAELYARHRADLEAALPFYIALHRRDPDAESGGERVEAIIRRTLDERRQALLKDADAPAVQRYLSSEDASLRAEACVRAAKLADPRLIDTLGTLLDDDTEIVRRNADYALYQLAGAVPAEIKARREAWLSAASPLTRARALNLFADLYPKETLPLVEKALYDSNPALRYLAKTLALDRYYDGVPEARKVKAEYLSQERNTQVLAQYDRDRRAAPRQ